MPKFGKFFKTLGLRTASLSTTSTTRRSAKPSRRRHLRKISRLTSSTPTRALKTSWWLKCQWIDFGHSSKASKQTANMAISPSPTRAHPTTRSRPSPRRLSAETKAQAGRPAFLKSAEFNELPATATQFLASVFALFPPPPPIDGAAATTRSVRLTMNEPCPLRDSVPLRRARAGDWWPWKRQDDHCIAKGGQAYSTGMTPGQSALFLSFSRAAVARILGAAKLEATAAEQEQLSIQTFPPSSGTSSRRTRTCSVLRANCRFCCRRTEGSERGHRRRGRRMGSMAD